MRIKLFTFQKDEDDILEDWIRYHSEIFGSENIYIIDHNSKKSKETINKYNVGCESFCGPFTDKARQLTSLMKRHRETCDILVPLDVDEFIVGLREGKISCDKEEIINEFKSLERKDSYKFRSTTIRGPESDDTLIDFQTGYEEMKNSTDRWKTFYDSSNFKRTDQGNHGYSRGYARTNLGLLHFHSRGFKHFKMKHMRWKEAYGESPGSGGTHWKKTYDIIKDMDDEEMYRYWQNICDNKTDNTGKYDVFKEKIRELRNA